MLRYFSLLGAVSLTCALAAQSADPHTLVPDGGTARGPDIMLTYTVGELATATLPAAGGYLTEGFQQPVLFLQPPAPGSAESESPVLTVFPNPVTEQLRLRLTEASDRPLRLELFDTAGRLLWQSSTRSGIRDYRVDVANYPAGTYHLRVSSSSHPQTFTVVKK